jgi:hypothetical protein
VTSRRSRGSSVLCLAGLLVVSLGAASCHSRPSGSSTGGGWGHATLLGTIDTAGWPDDPFPVRPSHGTGIFGSVFREPACDRCGQPARPLSGVIVAARGPTGAEPIATVRTDSFGSFALPLHPGAFLVEVLGEAGCRRHVVRVTPKWYVQTVFVCEAG